MIVGGIAIGNVTNYADIALSKDSDNLDNGTGSLSLMARTEGVVIATVRENIVPNLPGNTANNLAVLNYNNENANVQLFITDPNEIMKWIQDFSNSYPDPQN